jgi:hypothetical protein
MSQQSIPEDEFVFGAFDSRHHGHPMANDDEGVCSGCASAALLTLEQMRFFR